MKTPSKYVHTEIDHTLNDPAILVPLFKKMFSPKSVCDVGCGIGNFLYVFKQSGATRVLGLDGEWANKEILYKYLDEKEFRAVDFETKIAAPPTSFDLCICLEVAEHISEENANNFIDLLVQTSDTIIFSAAIPYQGGINHINEQKEEYWEAKFEKRGFKKFDIIRHQIFRNKKLSPHYRRNIIVYSKKDLSKFEHIPYEHYAIQENCQQRLYVDLVGGSLSLGRLSKFQAKAFVVKLSGRKLISLVKKLRLSKS